jgi:hypothetical protein
MRWWACSTVLLVSTILDVIFRGPPMALVYLLGGMVEIGSHAAGEYLFTSRESGTHFRRPVHKLAVRGSLVEPM